MSDKKHTTVDKINVLLSDDSPMEYQDLIDKLQDLFGKNSHKVYDKFTVSIEKDDKIGMALIFNGEREETKQETAMREAKEKAAQKKVEQAELKEYMRLHKKYGKKKK